MIPSVVSVAIIGGGPAGATAALLLARGGVDVVLFERSSRARSERGEVLAPEGRSALSQIGLWEQRPIGAMSPCNSMRIAWRSDRPIERSAITNPYGCGWHLNRTLFDDWLVAEAARAGAIVARPASVAHVVREGSGWRLDVAAPTRQQVFARVVVDAAGRSTPELHWSGARRIRHDALCAVLAPAKRSNPCPGLLVEAVPDGWCYSIAVGSDRAVVGFATDADILVDRGRGRSAIDSALEAAPLTRQRVGTPVGGVATTSACTTFLEASAGDGWIAVGDAALGHDPLAGQGILFALRSASRAALAVRGHLEGDRRTLATYAAETRVRILEYLDERRDVYAAQLRWRERPFWQRRVAVPVPKVWPDGRTMRNDLV